MWLVISLVSTVLMSVAQVYYKKVKELSTVSNFVIFLIWDIALLFIIPVYLYLGYFDPSYLKNWFFLWLVFFISAISLGKNSLMLNILKKEKMSTIAPYQNLNKIFAVVAWFLLMPGSSSVITLIITLIAWWIVIGTSIDFKTFKIPQNIISILIWQSIMALHIVLTWYVLDMTDDKLYFIYYQIIGLIIILFMITRTGGFKWFKDLSKWFYKLRFQEMSYGWVGYILSLFVMKTLGVVVTVLLSFVWLAVTLIMSYFVFWDKPSRKDILVTLIVTWLVWIWFIFK